MTSEPTAAARADLAGETDADLLVFMSMACEEALIAQKAWEEFYRRHVDYLYAVCLRAYGPLLGGEPGVCDLVADTFQRVYEHADHFDTAGITDRERLRRRVRAWLGRIAQRLAQSVLRGQGRLGVRRLEPEQWQQIAQEPSAEGLGGDPGAVRPEIDVVREAVATLSEKEQMVLRVTFQWYQPGAEHQRLANQVCAELAASLRTTPENLRQIRRRALNKIETQLRQHASSGSRNPKP